MEEFDTEALARLLVQKHNEQIGEEDKDSRLKEYDLMTASEKDTMRAAVGAVAREVATQIRKA